jgi:chemotaxis protein methyltransferase CheR
VKDDDCVRFLQGVLPRLDLKWTGYRKVRRTVRKRMGRRLHELRLSALGAYARLIEQNPEERARLDAFCRIPISRFYRDRGVFDALTGRLLPEMAERALATARAELRCWRAGCASGEEVYSLRLIWDLDLAARFPELRLTLLTTDADDTMLARAAAACYPPGSFKDAPENWPDVAFLRGREVLCLRPEYRHDIRFRQQDVRAVLPDGPFDLILCRNLVFTYFAEALQHRLAGSLAARLRPGGLLVLGAHENLPAESAGFERAEKTLPIWRRTENS